MIDLKWYSYQLKKWTPKEFWDYIVQDGVQLEKRTELG